MRLRRHITLILVFVISFAICSAQNPLVKQWDHRFGGAGDDLTGLFGVSGVPGVGISFGVDRIYDVLEELSLFPSELQVSTQVLFFNTGTAEAKKAFEVMVNEGYLVFRCLYGPQ